MDRVPLGAFHRLIGRCGGLFEPEPMDRSCQLHQFRSSQPANALQAIEVQPTDALLDRLRADAQLIDNPRQSALGRFVRSEMLPDGQSIEQGLKVRLNPQGISVHRSPFAPQP